MTVFDDIAAGRLRWASQPRLGSTLNEDRIGMNQDAVWVLDGAGTPSGVPSCCDKDAVWYVDRLDAALTTRLADSSLSELTDVLAAAITDVQEQHATSCPGSGLGGPSSTVAMARRRSQWLDLLVLGDSTILLDCQTHVRTLRDTRLAAIAPELRRDIKNAIAVGRGYDAAEHRNRRLELVHAERQRRNREGGYWIAADEPTAAAHALVELHQIGDRSPSVRRIALMTDGAHRATSVFALYRSDRELIDAAEDEGPASCIARIRAAEADDASGHRHPRTKGSDDASLVIWELLPRA
jgi:Protein phosphatase 2C